MWSFGITMIEISQGRFPYALWTSPFEQLKQVGRKKSSLPSFRLLKKVFFLQVVVEEPPKLPPGVFSGDYVDFLTIW